MQGFAGNLDDISWPQKAGILQGGGFSSLYKELARHKFLLEGDLEYLDLLTVMYYRMHDYQLAYYFARMGWQKTRQFFYRFYEVLALLKLGYYEEARDIFSCFAENFCHELENYPLCIAEVLDMFIVFFMPQSFLPPAIRDYCASNSHIPGVALYNLQEKLLCSQEIGKTRKLVDYIADILVAQLEGDKVLYCHACALVARFDEKRRERYLFYLLEEEEIGSMFLHLFGMAGSSRNYKGKIKVNTEKIKQKTRFFYGYMQDGDLEIISYPWSYRAGSMHVVKVKEKIVAFDLGDAAGESYNGQHLQDFMERSGIKMDEIKAFFISHAHFDHWGSLPILKGSRVPVYLTEDTYNLIGKISPGIFNGIAVRLLREGKPVAVDDSLFVEAFANGHILGSVGFILRAEGKRIVYTGDFCLHDQAVVKGLDLDKICGEPTDVLIMETTYGRREESVLNYEDNRILLVRLVEELVAAGLKVLLPAFAIGRAQEIAAALADMKKPRCPVLLDGQAVPVFHYFENRVAGFKEKSAYVNVLSGGDVEGNLILYPVIIASSGMLKRGSTSYRYLERLMHKEKFALIQAGYMEEDDSISFLKAFDDYKLVWFRVNISAHAGYNDLLYTLECLQPDKVVMVHGEGLEGFELA